jgi:4a-hydroxytetrahydrobiopterin dehydratase
MTPLESGNRKGRPLDVRLSPAEIEEQASLVPKWVLKGESIEREFQFKDFRSAVDFVNRVADLAEEHDHHPDILISYTKVRLVLSTHKVGGLSGKDFLMAAGIDRLIDERKSGQPADHDSG